MPRSIRSLIGIVLIAVVIIGTGPAFFLLGAVRAHYARQRLLCNTDHAALLNAGREVLAQVHIESDPNRFHRWGAFNVPKDVPIPKMIRDLRAGIAIAYAGYLILGMHGGMDHFGVHIFPEDFQPPTSDFHYGDHKLLDGLWYYDDEYAFDPEQYKEVVDK